VLQLLLKLCTLSHTTAAHMAANTPLFALLVTEYLPNSTATSSTATATSSTELTVRSSAVGVQPDMCKSVTQELRRLAVDVLSVMLLSGAVVTTSSHTRKSNAQLTAQLFTGLIAR
jgi:hypothetical protein